MREHLTVVTRKGQITLPAEIRHSLHIKEGDKVAVSLAEGQEGREGKVIVKPVRSVAEMTFGAVRSRRGQADFKELRREFEEGLAQEVLAEIEPPARPNKPSTNDRP